MITFCRDFDRAVSDAAKQQKAKERSHRKEHQKQLIQQEHDQRRANDGGNPDDGSGAPGVSRPRSRGKLDRNTQNASVLEKAKSQNPHGMASVLEEIQKKKGSGQDLLRKTPVPSPAPSGQENTSHPHYANSRTQASEAAATANHLRAAPQAPLQAQSHDYGPPSRDAASPQRYQQSSQPNYVARSPNVDMISVNPISSSGSASLRNHALRDKVRQRRQRRMAASEPTAPVEGPSSTVDWPFPRNEAAK